MTGKTYPKLNSQKFKHKCGKIPAHVGIESAAPNPPARPGPHVLPCPGDAAAGLAPRALQPSPARLRVPARGHGCLGPGLPPAFLSRWAGLWNQPQAALTALHL